MACASARFRTGGGHPGPAAAGPTPAPVGPGEGARGKKLVAEDRARPAPRPPEGTPETGGSSAGEGTPASALRAATAHAGCLDCVFPLAPTAASAKKSATSVANSRQIGGATSVANSRRIGGATSVANSRRIGGATRVASDRRGGTACPPEPRTPPTGGARTRSGSTWPGTSPGPRAESRPRTDELEGWAPRHPPARAACISAATMRSADGSRAFKFSRRGWNARRDAMAPRRASRRRVSSRETTSAAAEPIGPPPSSRRSRADASSTRPGGPSGVAPTTSRAHPPRSRRDGHQDGRGASTGGRASLTRRTPGCA